MKNFTHLLKSFFLLVLLGNTSLLKAQTSVDIVSVADSSYSLCPIPASVSVYIYGTASGYDDVTDNITVHVFWGDGTDNVINCDLYPSTLVDYFVTNPTHSYSTAGTYTPMIIATGPDGNDDTAYAGTYTLTTGCITIDGYTYSDNNSNCVFDTGDDTLWGVYIKVTDAGGNVIGLSATDLHGHYHLTIPSGLSSLWITAYSESFMVTSCPVAGGYSFNSSSSTSFNFGLECLTTSADYYIHHSAYCGMGAPGSNGVMSFMAGVNACAATTSIPATITLTLDPLVSYTSMISGPAPSSVVGNVLTWNTSLNPATAYAPAFHVSFETHTSASATVMTPSCFNLEITGPATDINTYNNSEYTCLLIGGPYDPNNKEVIPAGMGAAGYVAPETEFVYTLNFQNTGTAPAIDVYVMDTISNNLDMASFQIVGSSHDMNPIFNDARIVRFDFPNINLPDSSTSEALSHGWVKYRIKAKTGLPNGTTIKNTGHIYFDYNPAIVTNTTLNTIDMTLGATATTAETNTFAVYPNPSGTYVNINAPGAEGSTALVYDVTGKMITAINLVNTNTTLDISSWTNGLYEVVIPQSSFKTVRFQKID